ncbi:MAG: GNAT family N-acetyltransferase [Flavobacterium psychrophilum]
MDYHFRVARLDDLPQIWTILQQAILRRKTDGSNQWQDGYPNLDVVAHDIAKEVGYVLTHNDKIIAYCAILINDEPEYANLEGKWLTNSDFVVFHRIAVADEYLGQGLARLMFDHIESFARQHHIYSIKADTNFDNAAMLHLFAQTGYVYCGEVYFRGSARKAFEKVVIN